MPATAEAPITYPWETLDERDDFLRSLTDHLRDRLERRVEARGGGSVLPEDVRAEMDGAYRQTVREKGWGGGAAA